MTTLTRKWDRETHDAASEPVDGTMLRRLVDGDVPVVVFEGLAPSATFQRNRAAIRQLLPQSTTTRYANGALTTIGPYLAKHLADTDAYFREAERAESVLATAGVDIATEVRTQLAGALGLASLEPAVEPDGRRYAPAVVRIHADGVSNPLHNDNIARDARGSGLSVSRIRSQLSCVVCLAECDAGGELVMHRKSWEPADEAYKVPGGLGYRSAVTGGAERHEFRPRAEDVYLINPTMYHEINRVSGADRLTLGFFIGFYDDDLEKGVVWG
jgi:hypothetical protein